jgi:hypothetical protein
VYKVIVYPKRKGDHGFLYDPAEQYTAEEEERICKAIQNDIKRHVDNISQIIVEKEEE